MLNNDVLRLIEPKSEMLDGKTYYLSKFPAVAGREIITQYIPSAIPKVGDYSTNERMMLKLMSHVAVDLPGGAMRLDEIEKVNNHVPSWQTLMTLEYKMMEYNASFFQNGRISNLLTGFAQSAPQWITKILTDFLAQLSTKIKPPSTN